MQGVPPPSYPPHPTPLGPPPPTPARGTQRTNMRPWTSIDVYRYPKISRCLKCSFNAWARCFRERVVITRFRFILRATFRRTSASQVCFNSKVVYSLRLFAFLWVRPSIRSCRRSVNVVIHFEPASNNVRFSCQFQEYSELLRLHICVKLVKSRS